MENILKIKAEGHKLLEQYNQFILILENLLVLIGNELEWETAPSDTLTLARLQLERFELITKIQIQKRILADLQKHYEEIVLPDYLKQVDLCNQNFEKVYSKAKNIAYIRSGKNYLLIKQLLEDYNEENTDIDLRLELYNTLIELLK